MTREEKEKLIRHLKYNREIGADYLITDEDTDEIIKALEQDPCEDAIRRQAVLDKKDLVELEDGQSFYCISPEDVETLPSVTPQPKIGHWITKEAYSEDKAMGFTEQIVCSNCDMQNSYFSEWDECKNPISKTFIRSKFCPNCGCRMIEPQESEVRNEQTSR